MTCPGPVALPGLPAAPALIAFDMDGTLFDTHHTPLPSTLRAIHAALDRGVTIALASGRDAWALRRLAERAGLDPTRLVFFGLNGTTIVDGATNELVWGDEIPVSLLAPLMAHLRSFDITVSIPTGGELFVEDGDGYNVEVEAIANFQQVVVVERLEDVTAPARKVLMSGQPEVMTADHLAIAAPFRDRLDFAFSAATHFECTPRGANKGSALARYCELVGIAIADTVAFGDHENDLQMLAVAGLGVAMGNAQDSVKDIADLVTADNDSDGIALVLRERFGLG